MFYYLTGKIALLDANLAVVDCGGVGYACHASNYTLAQLRVGEEKRLYTYCNIKEDAFDIYGFASREELRLFELLLSVTGVGAKVALSILSAVTPDQLTLAIATGDEKTVTMAQGVGKKMAQRILLELRDKVGGELDFSGGVRVDSAASAPKSGKVSTAAAALAELGYSQAEVSRALKGADAEQMSVEELVRYGLRAMVIG